MLEGRTPPYMCTVSIGSRVVPEWTPALSSMLFLQLHFVDGECLYSHKTIKMNYWKDRIQNAGHYLLFVDSASGELLCQIVTEGPYPAEAGWRMGGLWAPLWAPPPPRSMHGCHHQVCPCLLIFRTKFLGLGFALDLSHLLVDSQGSAHAMALGVWCAGPCRPSILRNAYAVILDWDGYSPSESGSICPEVLGACRATVWT